MRRDNELALRVWLAIFIAVVILSLALLAASFIIASDV